MAKKDTHNPDNNLFKNDTKIISTLRHVRADNRIKKEIEEQEISTSEITDNIMKEKRTNRNTLIESQPQHNTMKMFMYITIITSLILIYLLCPLYLTTQSNHTIKPQKHKSLAMPFSFLQSISKKRYNVALLKNLNDKT